MDPARYGFGARAHRQLDVKEPGKGRRRPCQSKLVDSRLPVVKDLDHRRHLSASGNGGPIKSMDFTSARSELRCCRSKLSKQSGRIERDPVAHHVITGTRQLMRQRLHGEDGAALCSLPLVEAL